MTGAQLIIECLKAHGVTDLFGYPGGAIMPTYDAIYDSGLDHLLCRNEQGAAIAAIGYARSTGKVGVCVATSGPGATNLITGLGDAFADSVPLVAFTGQVAAPLIGTDAFQEADVLGLSLACTKHSYIVQSIEELPEIIASAFQIAQTGRPGPVLIDVPRNIQVGDVPEHIKPIVKPVVKPTALSELKLAEAKALLAQAKKPVLYVGGGVGMANATQAVKKFLQITKMPSVSTLKGLGSIDPTDPVYMGMIGMHGTRPANIAVHECDLLLVCGARFDDRVTGKLDSFAPQAKVIHCDIDAAEINKLRVANVALQGDLIQALEALSIPLAIDDWRAHIQTLKAKLDFTYIDNAGNRPIDPWSLLNTLSQRKPQNAVICTDVGQHQMWAAQYYPYQNERQLVTSGGLGTMGFGVPAAIGAKIANPDKEVVLFVGDGGFQMTNQELAILNVYKIPIKVIMLNNHSLGMVRQWQEAFYDGRTSESVFETLPDFQLMAQAYGIKNYKFDNPETLEKDLEVITEDVPMFIEIDISRKEHVLPMVPAGKSNHEMLGVKFNA